MQFEPSSALAVAVAFILCLFILEKEEPRTGTGLWVVGLWFVVIASRRVSYWFYSPGVAAIKADFLDSAILFSLEAIGLVILHRRKVAVCDILSQNRWAAVFFAFSFLSIGWSSIPVAGIKGFVKDLGQPLMALLVVTDQDRRQATRLLFRRSSYLLIPFSIILIKYYPSLGRDFSEWGGATNIGVTMGKNQLGSLCFVTGLFFTWEAMSWTARDRLRRQAVNILFLVMVGWLLYKAKSATATICLIIAVMTLWTLGRNYVREHINRLGIALLGILTAFLLINVFFDLSATVIATSGHEMTFSGRQELWDRLLEIDDAPIFGAGYASFWLQRKALALSESLWWHPNEAHNGYLETYLNLGLIGVLCLVFMLLSFFQSCKGLMLSHPELGQFCLALFAATLAYSVTEAVFRGLHILWFSIFLIGLSPISPSSSNQIADAVQTD